MSTKPTVVQPESVPMATEPVWTIQKQKMFVDGAAVLIAAAGFKLTQEQVSSAYHWVEVLWPAAYLVYTLLMNWHVARQIRASVFSPATVARLLQGARSVAGAFLPGDQATTTSVAVTTTSVPEPPTAVATDVATP